MLLNSKPHHQHWIPLGYRCSLSANTSSVRHQLGSIWTQRYYMCVYIRNCIHRRIHALASRRKQLAAGIVALWVPAQDTLSQREHSSFWTQVFFGQECLLLALLTPSFPALLPPPLRVFPWFPLPTWVRGLFYVCAQWRVLILCCS